MAANLQSVITNGTRLQMRHHRRLPTLLYELAESDGCFWPVFSFVDRTKKNRQFVAGFPFREFSNQPKHFSAKNPSKCAVRLNHRFSPTCNPGLTLFTPFEQTASLKTASNHTVLSVDSSALSCVSS